MIIPTYNGRKMELVKKYPSHILFQDKKSGIKMSFTYHELGVYTKQIEEIELKKRTRKIKELRTAI